MKKSAYSQFVLVAGLSLLLAGCLPTTQQNPTATTTPQTTTPQEEAATEKMDETMGEPPSPEAPSVSDKSDKELIIEAFQRKHPDWDLTQMDFEIQENTGEFATGGVGPKGGGPGGGAFFAAKTQAGWVIAWDGNGTIECADIEPYNFPTSMIPECYNSLTQEIITR